jgi:uncharacterized protein (TIGR00251 family)
VLGFASVKTKPPAAPLAGVYCTLAIKVIPQAPRDEVVGWSGAALKIKIRAPAQDGRANDALCEFIAETLGLPRRAVTIAHGKKSRQKLLRIDGLASGELRERFPGA